MKYIFILTLLFSTPSYSDVIINTAGFKSHIQWDDLSMNFDEKVYMTVNVIDMLQTMQHGPDKCYKEVDPITRRVIGRNPNPGQVVAWAVVQSAVGHYGFQLIDNSNLPKWLATTLKWTATAVRFDVVNNNYQMGLTLYGDHPDYYRGGPSVVECARQNGYL